MGSFNAIIIVSCSRYIKCAYIYVYSLGIYLYTTVERRDPLYFCVRIFVELLNGIICYVKKSI